MGFSDFYYKLEEKYYGFLDWLDDKGIHLYGLDDWMHEHNLPSFPIMLILFLIILALIIFAILYFSGVVGGQNVNAILAFKDITNNALVPNLSVLLTINSQEIAEITDASGEIALTVPKEELIFVSISSDDYGIASGDTQVFSENGQTNVVELKSKSEFLAPKTIKLYEDKEGELLFSGSATLEVTCISSSFAKSIEVKDGSAILNDVPKDCGLLEISSSTLKLQKEISLGIDNIEIDLKAESQPEGTLRVINVDENEMPLKNISVSVFTEDDVQTATDVTQETGMVEFSLPIAKYYVVATPSASEDYSLISTKEEASDNFFFEQVSETQVTEYKLHFKKNNIGKINLEILDVAGKPVQEAQIFLYKDDVLQAQDVLKSDTNGKYKRAVSEMGPYRIVIDAPQYMLYDNPNVMVSETPITVHMEPIKANPVLSVAVNASGDPVANAVVQLFKDSYLILTKNTGADGIAFFDKLESGKTYFVKVFKGEYASPQSKPIVLDPKVANKLEVNMVFGKGNIDVAIFDKQGNPLSNVNVELYDVFSTKQIGLATQTDAEGKAHFFGIGADKTVFAKAFNEKGVAYSLESGVQANAQTVLSLYLQDSPTTLALDLVGVYNADGSKINTLPQDVVAGQEYTALFLLGVPSGKPYSSGNIFVLGDGKSIAESNIYFKEISGLFGNATKGTTYTSPKGYAEDMQNKTSDSGLWASLDLSKVNAGSSLVQVKFGIISEPKTHVFKMNYRANVKSGSTILRTPVDSVLGQNESSVEKNGFYADTSAIAFKEGNLVCSNAACIDMSAKDTTGFSTVVYDSYPASYNSSTVLSFSLLSATKSVYKNAKLEIYAKNGGITIGNVSATSNNKALQTTKDKGKFTTILPVFNTSTDIKGTVGFTSDKQGDSILIFNLLNEQNEIIFTKEIAISVAQAKDMLVEYVPGIIVPYVKNLGAVLVTDANDATPISDAVVSVYLNSVLTGSGKTDTDGKLPVEIQKPNVGDVLKITASRFEYNSTEAEIKITENILIPEKPELSIIVDRAEQLEVNTNIVLNSYLPLKLRVVNVSFAQNEYLDFVNVSFLGNYANKEFDKKLDLNILASLTDLGKGLLEPKTFKTTLDVVVASDDVDKIWNVKIPVVIYIKLYDSLDAGNCLTLDLAQTPADNGMGFKVNNNCVYKTEPAILYNGTMLVNWDGTVLGTFFFNAEQLDEDGALILKEIKPKANTFSLTFLQDPKIASASSKITFEFKGYFPTNSGLQELTATKTIDYGVSTLSKCLQIISSQGALITPETAMQNPVVVGVTPYGLGTGMLGGLYNPLLGAQFGGLGGAGSPLGFNQFGGQGQFNQWGFTGPQGLNNDYLAQLQAPTGVGNPFLNQLNWSSPTGDFSPGVVPGAWNNPLAFNSGIGQQFPTSQFNPNFPQNQVIVPSQVNSINEYQRILGLRNGAGGCTPEHAALGHCTQGVFGDSIFTADNAALFVPFGFNSGINSGTSTLGFGGQQYAFGSPFANGQFGAMMPGAYLPPVNRVTLKNNCMNPVTVEVRAMPQILVNPPQMEIPVKKSADITVMSSMLPGTYYMNLLAGTGEDLSPLVTLPVSVIDYPADTVTEDCFKLSEEPTIDMSSFLQGDRKIISVYNYCYSKGVVFDEQKPIELMNLLLQKDVGAVDADGKPKIVPANTPYVQAVALGVPNTESTTSGTIQKLDVLLNKSLELQLPSKDFSKGHGGISDTVMNIVEARAIATQLTSNVMFPSLFLINAKIGYGQAGVKRTVKKLVSVRDFWNLLGIIKPVDELLGGNKTCLPSDWSKSVVSNFNFTIKQDYFEDGKTTVPYSKDGKEAFELLGVDCFGKLDEIKFIDEEQTVEAIFDNQSYSVEITPVFDDKKISFTVEPAEGTILPKGKGKLEAKWNYLINSYYFQDASISNRSNTFTLNLTFDLSKGVGDQPEEDTSTKKLTKTEADKKCNTAFGDEYNSLQSYGYGSVLDKKDNQINFGNMVSFRYDSKVDCAKTFCDAEQLKTFVEEITAAEKVDDYNQEYYGDDFDFFGEDSKIDIMFDKITKQNLGPIIEAYFKDKGLQDGLGGLTHVFVFSDKKCPKSMKNIDDKFLINYDKKCYVQIDKFKPEYFSPTQILLIPNKNSLYYLLSESKAYLVYLKPDNYKAVFESDKFLNYNVTLELRGFKEINESGVYLVAKTVSGSTTNAYLEKADEMLGDEKNDFFLYNLPVDPSDVDLGLCVKKGVLKINSGTGSGTEKIAAAKFDNCFATADFIETGPGSTLLFNIVSRPLRNFSLIQPTCEKGCSLKLEKENNTKTITAPSNSYMLKEVFEKPLNYCYSEDKTSLNIKYYEGASGTAKISNTSTTQPKSSTSSCPDGQHLMNGACMDNDM